MLTELIQKGVKAMQGPAREHLGAQEGRVGGRVEEGLDEVLVEPGVVDEGMDVPESALDGLEVAGQEAELPAEKK